MTFFIYKRNNTRLQIWEYMHFAKIADMRISQDKNPTSLLEMGPLWLEHTPYAKYIPSDLVTNFSVYQLSRFFYHLQCMYAICAYHLIQNVSLWKLIFRMAYLVGWFLGSILFFFYHHSFENYLICETRFKLRHQPSGKGISLDHNIIVWITIYIGPWINRWISNRFLDRCST